MLCKIWGFHGGDSEECRLLRHKNPVRTSLKTHYFSATRTSRLMMFLNCDYEECRLLGRDAVWFFWKPKFRNDILTRIGELGTILAVTINRIALRRNMLFLAGRLSSPWWWRWYGLPKRLLLQESQDVTSQKAAFFKKNFFRSRTVFPETVLNQRVKAKLETKMWSWSTWPWTAQASTYWLSTAEALVRYEERSCVICGGMSGA
jgi:hypothetical protein